MNPKQTSPVSTGLKIVIIIVIVIVLLLVSFAMIKLVPAVFTTISNFRNTLSFFGNKEQITLTLDKKSIPSGGSTILSWKQQRGNGDGEHIFNYPCDSLDNDTHVELTETDGELRSIFCGEDVFFGNAGESDFRKITLTGFSSIDEDQILNLTVSHVSATSTVYASSSIPLTIKKSTERNIDRTTDNNNASSTENEFTDDESETVPTNTKTTTTPKPSTATYSKPKSSQQTSTYRTPVDLGVVFTKSEIRSNDDGIVEFQVINYGQTSSGLWKFRAVVPQNDDDVIYNSPYQSSIPGGKASIMTLRFENADRGTVEVYVDYANQIRESNENNNRATVRVN
jgi:hypothetical protein